MSAIRLDNKNIFVGALLSCGTRASSSTICHEFNYFYAIKTLFMQTPRTQPILHSMNMYLFMESARIISCNKFSSKRRLRTIHLNSRPTIGTSSIDPSIYVYGACLGYNNVHLQEAVGGVDGPWLMRKCSAHSR